MKRLVCAVIGHAKPYRATMVWLSTWRRWSPVDDSVSVAVCGRCRALMPGQGLMLKYR